MLSQYRGRGFYDPLSVNEMDRLFSEMFGDFVRRERTAQGKPNGVWAPAIDVAQKDQDLVVRAELPGTKPEDVDISLQNRILTISGTSKGAAEDVDYYVQELPYGEFRCSVMVPEGVNPDSIKARLENGVLEVVLPGMAREARPTKKVAVETGKMQQKEEASIFPTKILLATDGSEEAELALLTAVDLANRTNSELHMVHVSEYVPMFLAYTEEEPAEREREAREVLDEQVKKIEEAGGAVAEAHIRMGGRPDQRIVELAEELGIGLIAMGSRGLGGIRRALMGSVSDSVVQHAHCPVLVARRGRQEEEQGAASIFPTKILLATDGSEEANLAAQTAADIAEKTGSELHLVHVRSVPAYIDPSSERIEIIESAEEDVRNEAQQVLDAQIEQIKAAGGNVAQTHVRLGRPDEEIVLLAKEIGAGLIEMGSRGLGGIRRVFIGSVSDSVVRHAHCPVLVVREEKV